MQRREFDLGEVSPSAWHALGSSQNQWLTLELWEPWTELRVDVTSGSQVETRIDLITEHCVHCPMSTGDSVDR